MFILVCKWLDKCLDKKYTELEEKIIHKSSSTQLQPIVENWKNC